MAVPERNFGNLKTFVRKAFDESFMGSVPVSNQVIDESIPYSIIKGKVFEAVFDYRKIRPNEVMVGIEERPTSSSTERYKRSNATLLYVAVDQDEAEWSPNQIAKAHDIPLKGFPSITRGRVSEIHKAASPSLRAEHPLESFDFNKPKKKSTDSETPKFPEEFEGLGNADSSDEEIQRLLDMIPTITIFYELSQAGLVTNIQKLRKTAGVVITSTDIPLIVDELGVPVRKIKNRMSKDGLGRPRITFTNIFASIHEQRIVDRLRDTEFMASIKQQSL